MLQLPLTLPGKGAGAVGEKVATTPTLLALSLPGVGVVIAGEPGALLPLVLPLPALLAPVPLLPSLTGPGGVVVSTPLLSLSPPPHAVRRRNALAAAIATNAALGFMPKFC